MYDDDGASMDATSPQQQNTPSSSSTPPSPLGLQGPALLSSFHATYRSLFHHLPASLRPPGIQFLEDAEYPPKPSSSSFRRGSAGGGGGGTSPSLPPLTTLRWASRLMRRAIRLCLARVAQDEEEGGMEGVLAPLTPEVRSAMAVTRSFPLPHLSSSPPILFLSVLLSPWLFIPFYLFRR